MCSSIESLSTGHGQQHKCTSVPDMATAAYGSSRARRRVADCTAEAPSRQARVGCRTCLRGSRCADSTAGTNAAASVLRRAGWYKRCYCAVGCGTNAATSVLHSLLVQTVPGQYCAATR
eukprot:3276265-Rhodomonas_salina.1